jgi:hypothetical protein
MRLQADFVWHKGEEAKAVKAARDRAARSNP